MAEMQVRLLLIFLFFNFVQGIAKLSFTENKTSKVVFVYPIDAVSERDLSVCQEKSACNIVYKRFWLPPVVERLCRCPSFECSSTWSPQPDNRTMLLDNRSQLKFCKDITQLPKCVAKKTALVTVTQKLSNDERQHSHQNSHNPFKNGHKPLRSREQTNVTVFCNCQEPHYWKIKLNATKIDHEQNRLQQAYTCSKLKKCHRAEFCGNVRTDTYSTFYRCSCPKGHLCISKDTTVYETEELLFNGISYKAHCFPHEKM